MPRRPAVHQEPASDRRPVNVTYGVPWGILAAVIVGGSVVHSVWGERLPAAALAASGILAGTAALTWLTWQHARGRDPVTRGQAAVTVALAGGALWRSLAAGVDPGWISTEVLLGSVVALSWNIRSMRVVRGDGRDSHASPTIIEQIGLDPGTRVARAKVDGPRAEVAVRAAGGQTADDVAKAATAVGGLLHLPPNSVRTVPHPDDSSRATWVMTTQDVLREPIPWPGPSAPGGSIADGLLVGMYEDGQPEMLWLPGDPGVLRTATHLGVMGSSGTGKSGLFRVAAVEILTRADAVLMCVDARKALQLPVWLRDAVDWLVSTAAAAKIFFAALKRAVAYRSGYLGQRRLEEWTRGCGIPYLVVWVEEASEVIADSDTFISLTESCRSVGIGLVASMQRASGNSIPTDAREQLGAGACFGLNERGSFGSAQFILSEATIAAGAHPERWGISKPGYHFLEAPGVPEDRWSMPARTFDVRGRDPDMAAAVAGCAEVRAALDEGTAQALGAPYANRAAQPAPAHLPTEGQDVDDDAEYRLPPQPEPELAARVNPREPIPAWDGEDLRLDGPDDGQLPMSRDAKEAVFEEILLGFARAGQDEVRTGELVVAWRERTGQPPNKGRPFIHEMLRRRIDQGQIERLDGGQGAYRLHLLVSPNGHRE